MTRSTPFPTRLRVLAGCAVLGWLLAAPGARAQTTAEFFKQTCTGCHTIGGGRLVGPDLKDVTVRRDAAWLEKFLPNPQALIEAGDPIALGLARDSQGIVMPAVPGMTPGRVKELIEFLANPGSQPAAAPPAVEKPFTPEDVAAGRAIFVGEQRLKGGGPPCVSCHAVSGLGALGGGRLGPDLTLALERLQGRRGLTAWLGAPATPTMQSVFRNAAMQEGEVTALVAFLDETARTGQPADAVGQLNFFMLGLAGSIGGLVLADAVWRRRFRAVRRPLVEGDRAGAHR